MLARRTGVLYLSLLPLGIFSFVYVPSVLVVSGDAAATVANIRASATLFRLGTVSHLLSQVIAVFLVLSMYRLLAPVNRGRARLMAVMALVGVPVSFAGESFHLAALHLLAADDAGWTDAQVRAHAMLLLDARRSTVLLAQVAWGLWLLPLGSLVFRSGFLPRPLGVLAMVAGIGYLVDSAAHVLATGAVRVSQLTCIGELALALWLAVRGVGAGRWPGAPA